MRATQTATAQMTCVNDIRKHRKIRALLSAILDAEWVLPSLDEVVVIEAIDGLTSVLGRQPTLEELADTVGAPEHSVRSMLHSLVQKGYLEASTTAPLGVVVHKGVPIVGEVIRDGAVKFA